MKKLVLFTAIQLLAATAVLAQPPGMPGLTSDQGNDERPPEIIYKAPEGNTIYYKEAYEGFMYFGDDSGPKHVKDTLTNKIVWYSNNEVYINNPVAAYNINAFAKGTYADGKIKVELPQCIYYYYDNDGTIHKLYLNKLEEVEQDGEKHYMICYPEDNYIEYNVDDTGKVTLDIGNAGDYDVTNGENPPYIVGVTDGNEPNTIQAWTGYGDTHQTWNVFDNGDPVTPPDGAVMQEWAFKTPDQKSIIKVAVDGNDIYIEGLASYINGYWFKGTMEDGKITFPTKQYMGLRSDFDMFLYFMAAKVSTEETSQWKQYEPIDKVTLVYDPETGMYKAQEDETFIISTSNEQISAIYFAENPSIWKQNQEIFKAKPLNPSLEDYKSNPNVSTIVWNIPNENENGAILPGRNMYYNLYVDGELYTFTPEKYSLFTEPTTDVPYEAVNYYDIDFFGTVRVIYLKQSVNETVGLQSFYVDEDGTKYASDLITEKILDTGVSNIDGGKQAVSTEYFNLSGVKTTRPAAGMYIMKTKYNDGTSSVKKVLVK